MSYSEVESLLFAVLVEEDRFSDLMGKPKFEKIELASTTKV